MNKYHARKAEFNGIAFDSKHERDRYVELMLMQKAGVIQDLQTQVEYPLIDKSQYGRKIVYRADFTYILDGKLVVEDTKSPVTKTSTYRLKKRLLAERYGIVIKET